MSTLRLPQFTIETSGMKKKSKSLEPLSFFKEGMSSGGSSPLPDTLETFVNDFRFDSLEPRSKSAEPLLDSGKSRCENAQVSLEELHMGLVLTGMMSADNRYLAGGQRSARDEEDEEDIKVFEVWPEFCA